MPFSPKRLGSVAYSMVMFVVVSVIAGLLVAGLAVPFAGMAGVSSRAAATELHNLPADLATPPQSERSKVLDVNGKVIAYFYDENRVYVPTAKIAPVMRQAQLAIEDSRFYEHGPLDLKGTLRALLRNSASGTSQGGSSITQQYVKLVQVEKAVAEGDKEAAAAAQESTYTRKIQELRYAIALEQKLSKDEILERYLNIAYYGEGAYGVEAAARHYFGVSAAKLDLPQAAMLAGLVQNPDANNPVDNEVAAIDRRDFVLNRMVENKIVTADEAAKAKKVTFDESKVKPTKNGCVATKYPFLCDYVKRTLLQSKSLGANVEARQNQLNRGGLTIETKIDPKAQDKAQKAVSEFVDPRDPIISVMTMIEPGTGLIYAMAQSRPVMGSNVKKGETYYNYAVSGCGPMKAGCPEDMGGAEGYQAGSTFKAFTAAAAIQKGIPLSKKYNAKNRMDFSGREFDSCKGREKVYGKFPVGNSTVSGTMDMYRATAMSVNTYYVQLELAAGMCNVTKMAKKAGVDLADPNLDIVDEYQDKPSFTLGTAEVTPLSMSEAYATFAARGIHCDPIVISKIKTKAGKELAAPSANCERVMSKEVADGVTALLSRVMSSGGTGNPARIPGVEHQAGKTGTIDKNQAVWFAGFTSKVAGASMIAIDKTRAPFKKGSKDKRSGLKGYTMKYSKNYLNGSGGGDAGAKIWKPAMTAAMKGKPDVAFKKASKDIREGKMVQMPKIGNLSMADYTKKLEEEGFTVETTRRYSKAPRNSFLGWSPGGGMVQEFGTVYKVYSAGEDPAIARAREERRRAKAEEARQERIAERRAEREREKKAEQQKKKQEEKKKKKKN